MKRVAKIFVLTSAISVLTSCGYFKSPTIIQGRNKQYLAAHSIAPLHVPPGMSNSAFINEYSIPSGDYANTDKSVNITPPGIKTN